MNISPESYQVNEHPYKYILYFFNNDEKKYVYIYIYNFNILSFECCILHCSYIHFSIACMIFKMSIFDQLREVPRISRVLSGAEVSPGFEQVEGAHNSNPDISCYLS